MDPTTALAVICSTLIFAGWIVLPHAPASVETLALSEERRPVPVSA